MRFPVSLHLNTLPFRRHILTSYSITLRPTFQFEGVNHANLVPVSPSDIIPGINHPITPHLTSLGHIRDFPLMTPIIAPVSGPVFSPNIPLNFPIQVLSDTHIESLGSRNPKVFLHPYPNVIASHFTKTVSKRKGMPILNDLHDRHFMTPTRHHLNGDILSTNACYYVSCKDLAFYCNSTRTRRRSRPNRTKKRPQSRSDLPFSCGLHEVCCNLDSLDLSLVGTPLSPSSGRSCGTSTVNAVNGRIKSQGIAEGEAKFGEFPWQAAILKKEGTDNVYICAGTFIDESHVLTAAHCVEGYKATQLRVRLGEWDVNRDTEFYSHIEYDAIGVAVHPDFFSGNLINDIALIRMLYPVDLDKNPHISPICLPATGSDYSGRRCWVSGWGKNGFGKNGKYQNLLKKVDVPVVPRQVCQEILRETRLGQDYFLHKGMLCAGGEPEKDACKGDGGGPLSCPDVHGNFVLVGIVSWGIGCGQQGVPGVYTNVEYYRSWISKMIESK